MIGLDTNILVRYLAQDDPIQSVKATEVIERRLTDENPGFVSIVVMVETAWVLERAYYLTPLEIFRAIERWQGKRHSDVQRFRLRRRLKAL